MATLHKFRITSYKIDYYRQEIAEERLEYDCMKSYIIRARCTKLLKKLLANGEPDTVHAVQFSNETLGISDTITGYNGKIVRGWDQ